MLLLIILTVLSIILIGLGIYFNANERGDKYIFSGVISLLFVILIGWLLIGSEKSFDYKSEIITFKLETTNFSLVMFDSDRDSYYVFDRKEDFSNITDTTKFYLERGYNLYGNATDYFKVYYIYNNQKKLAKIYN